MHHEGKRIAQALLFALAALLAHTAAAKCDPQPGLSHFYSDGWGIELNNQRLQRDTTINPDTVGRLKLAWSYGFANMKPRSWPLVSDDTIFIGDSGRGVVALDRRTGCTRWVHEFTEGDAWNSACDLGLPNCPDPRGVRKNRRVCMIWQRGRRW